MPLEPGSPEEWLRHARGDLALAWSYDIEGILLEALCFHAQQAAEKSIKAVLIAHGVPFPRVHSIERLLDLLPAEVVLPEEMRSSARLSAYATTFRYPGLDEPVSEDEYREAVRLAEKVVSWAEKALQSGSA